MQSRAEILQQEVQGLQNAHAAALTQLDTNSARAQQYLDELSQCKASLDAEKTKTQQCLEEIDRRDLGHQQLQSQIKVGETKTQQLTQELNNLQASFQRNMAEMKDKSQAQQQLEVAHANDLAEAHRMAKFFKKNSEATTRKTKGLEAELQSLRQSLQKGRGVQENSIANVVAQDNNFSDPPGAWPETDIQRSSHSLRRKPLALSNLS